LVNKEDLRRLHIVLDASKVNRCIWCGSPLSDHWILGEEGSYCSDSCAKAKSSDLFLPAACMTIILLPLLVAIWSITSSFFDPNLKFQAIIVLIAMVILSAILSISTYRDRRYAAEVPQGSRRHIGVSEVSLLRRISAPVDCPNCDAKINLTNVGEDMIYHCQYCGASGIVEIDMLE